MISKVKKVGSLGITRLLENDRYIIQLLRKNWKVITGEIVAEYSFPSFFSKGRLTVIVENSIILNEMKIHQNVIMENIRKELFINAVEEIYIKKGSVFNEKKEKEQFFQDYQGDKEEDFSEILVFEKEEAEKIEKIFSEKVTITDEKIAGRIKKIALNSKLKEGLLKKKGYKKCDVCSELFLGDGDICIKCENEEKNRELASIKKEIEKNPLISYKEIFSKYNCTENEYYRARDTLAEEMTFLISELIEEKEKEKAEKAAEKYAVYRIGTNDNKIIKNLAEKILGRITRYLEMRRKI